MDVILNNIKDVSIIVLTAYPLTLYNRIQRSISMEATLSDRTVLTLVFASLVICGNLTTTAVFNDAVFNSGLVASVVGGVIAGPAVGSIAGLMGGVHRLSIGGFTMVADCLADIFGGLVGGLVYCRAKQRRLKFTYSFLAGIVGSILNNVLILMLAEPQILGITFLKWVGLTSVLVAGVGTGLFVSTVKSVQKWQYSIGTSYAEKATEIAQQALQVIKGDIDATVAQQLVQIINASAIADAVAISDGQYLLAFAGQGSDIHTPGSRDLLSVQQLANKSASQIKNEVFVFNSKAEIGCSLQDCPHDAAVIAPLNCGNDQLWFLHVYKTHGLIQPPDIKLVKGIANLLSLHIQNSRLQYQAKQLAQAEFAALRSQINPHFLFNTLSAIKLEIRENPENAQRLLLALASFFRRTLEVNKDIIPLSEELKCVDFYLTIQQARFGDKFKVEYDIDPECMAIKIPSFIIQLLVENSLTHGFSRNNSTNWLVKIKANINNNLFTISVEDNGSGISQDIIEAVESNKIIRHMGVGLTNIKRRLKSFFGEQCTFQIKNLNPGTAVTITIPLEVLAK